MITTKERAILRGIAQKYESVFQVGKNGVTDNFLKQISDALDAREMLKINVLKSCDNSPRQILDNLCEVLNADGVQAIGNKIVIYRRSSKTDIEHIL